MKPATPIKLLIWLYVALLIFEGALRKWVLPGSSDMLLIVRDPVVILIYLIALAQGRFPFNGWVVALGILIVGTTIGSFMAGQNNLLITCYGLRVDFLHVPLIWVMASVLTRRDAENIGKALLLLAIPMTLLMVAQFRSPADSYINRGVGESEGIGQLYGALGHIRPPGFFSFITGPQLFYPLVAAFFCYELTARRRLWWPLLASCGVAIIIALPVSISRTVAVTTAFVGVIFVLCQVRLGLLRPGLLRSLFIAAVVLTAVSFLPIFDDAREAFLYRWELAAGQAGDSDVMATITDRVFGGWDYLLETAGRTKLFGAGIGMGSNVAAKFTTGRLGFLLAEDEWAKCLLELGLPLALAFLGYRLILALSLLKTALARLLHARDALPLLIFSATGWSVIFGQWAPPTILGFAILGGGLCLTASQDDLEEDDLEDEEDADEDSEEDEEEDTDEPDGDEKPEDD